MVRDDGFTGDYNRNLFNIQHFNLNYMAMNVNSQLVPRIRLEPNFTTNENLGESLAKLEVLMLDPGPYTWPITREQWANGYNRYIFKLSPVPIAGLRSNQLTLDARLVL